MRRARILWTTLGVALATSACGAQDIELGRGPSGSDGGAVEAQASDRPEAGVDALVLGESGGAPVCDASAPPPACRSLGDSCGSNADCCSTHCASGACATPGACAGAGAPCASRAECCSGLCEPVEGTATRACLASCRPAGAACARASDCCSFACNGGTCGGAECLREGSDCTSSAECCSNACDPAQGSKCVLDPVAGCRPTGEDCTSGGGAPCCGSCGSGDQRCDPGPGPCRAIGTVCTSPTDCCHGSCSADATGRLVCTSPLLAADTSCQAGFECASGSCVADPPVCGAAAKVCGITGAPCATGGDCCSGECTAALCQAGCIPTAP